VSAFCPTCGAPVDWVTATRAARILGVSERHVRSLLKDQRFPGAVKYDPQDGTGAFWKIPVASVAARIQMRHE
jgi:MarR-like DNA-binding transcriptional regulator SgrR of sgrS sRNA